MNFVNLLGLLEVWGLTDSLLRHAEEIISKMEEKEQKKAWKKVNSFSRWKSMGESYDYGCRRCFHDAGAH